MSKDESLSMPGVFGGLLRYSEGYESKFMLTPMQVIIAILVFAFAVIILTNFF